MGKLTSRAVEELMVACLFDDSDPVVFGKPDVEILENDNVRKVEGVLHTYAFDIRKLSIYTNTINELLAELPDQFHSAKEGGKGGGGWSFLNACDDRHGEQWTGLHLQMERLFCLGIAIGSAKWLLPRDLWKALPGGMPYVSVL